MLIVDGEVKRIYSDPYSDDLMVTGTFWTVNDSTGFDGVFRWDGSSVTTVSGIPLGSWTPSYGNVMDCKAHGGRLYISGAFTNGLEGSPYPHLAIWDTAGYWAEQLEIVHSTLERVSIVDSMMCVGVTLNGPDNVACFFTYDGTSWDSIPFPAGPTQAGSFRAGLVRYDDRFFAAGNVPYPGGSDIFEWEGGSSFIPAWPGQSGQGYFSDMVIYNGELVVAGYFLEAWGNPGNCIAAYDGISWRPLYTAEGPENPTAFPAVWDLLVHDGILYATGYFSHMDGEAANHVAWWDGTQWHGLGAEGMSGVQCAEIHNGELYVSGSLNLDTLQSKKRIGKYTGILPVGINTVVENEDMERLAIYPNPSTGPFTLTWQTTTAEAYSLTLYDTQGRAVHTRSGQATAGHNAVQLELSHLPPGLYLLEAHHADGRRAVKRITLMDN
jgi:hypothetical protein